MKCSRCQQQNPVADAEFCPRCGAPAKHSEQRTTPAASFSDLQRELAEAREQQTATSEILRVISSSPADVQPVFDAIARNARQLLHGHTVAVTRLVDDELQLMSYNTTSPAADEVLRAFHPIFLARVPMAAQTVHERVPAIVSDIETDPAVTKAQREVGRARGFRSFVYMPMVRDEVAIGLIAVTRQDPGRFTDGDVALLKTFADQAVIAIENVRLFRELESRNRDLTEALDQQTATSEILRVISSSPTDVQPVFDAIVASATRLCRGLFSAVYRYDGELIHLVAHHNFSPTALAAARQTFPMPPGRGGATARAVLTRQVVHIPDLRLDPEYAHQALARDLGFPSILAVPMLREGLPIGAIVVAGAEAVPFSDKQISLLQTFADQAVIAIENVRLFTELRTSNRDLTMALDKQTATSDILRVISGSQTDVQPVFDAIIASAVRLLGAYTGTITRIVGDQLELAALKSTASDGDAVTRTFFPRPVNAEGLHGHTLRERAALNVADFTTDPRFSQAARRRMQARGYHSWAAVPLLRHDEAIGTIAVTRREVGGFTDDQIALLQTFADQAVIAIENVRLFTELEARNRDLTATSEILQVIARSPTDVQPVLDAVAEAAGRLCGASDVLIRRVDEETMRVAAHFGSLPIPVGADVRPITRESPAGRGILERRTIHVHDASSEVAQRDYPELTEIQQLFGFRTVLATPLVRENTAIGIIIIRRDEVQPFSEKQVALLQAFADQAVIAIENVRLFKELEARNSQLADSLDQQTATAEILSVISRSRTDVRPVFETILERAATLCEAQLAHLWLYEGGEQFRLGAGYGSRPDHLQWLEQGLHRIGRPFFREIGPWRVGQVLDVRDTEPYRRGEAFWIQTADHEGMRTLLGVPLVKDGRLVGSIAIYRREVRPFTDAQVALVKTFADQAVIAIENVRLFTELQEKNRALTAAHAQVTEALEQQMATSEILGVISSSPKDVQPVFDAIIANAVRLCGGVYGIIWRYDGEVVGLVGLHNLPVEGRDELIGQFPRHLDDVYGPLSKALRTGTIVDIPDVGRYDDPNGRMRKLWRARAVRSVVIVPIRQESGVAGAISVSHPEVGAFSSERVELLKTFASQAVIAIENVRLFNELEAANRHLEAASQHKSEFLANMSHELRTPLNAVIGFSEVLNERMFGDLNDKQADYLKDIHASGQHLLSLINDILDLSKIEAGKMELELSDFDLPSTIDNALTLVRERAGRRGIELQRTVDERLGPIHGDERKLRQVLLNLLSNAIKFTPEGGRIEVRAVPIDQSVEVSVADTGVGIAPGDQEAIFEEFKQVGTASKKVEGTGLGLALSRKFIELHGGRIWVKSDLGSGATFTFTIPVRRGE